MHGDVVDAAHVDGQADRASQRNDQQGEDHGHVARFFPAQATGEPPAGGDGLSDFGQAPLQ